MPDRIVMDLDDWTDATAYWATPILDRLYAESEGRLRVTLFAVPAYLSTYGAIRTRSRPWIELAVHGHTHAPNECAEWDAGRVTDLLGSLPPGTYAPVFRAPYWVTSPGLYEGLADAGWAVADHPSNAEKIPPRLARYVLSPEHGIGDAHRLLPVIQAHGHVENVMGNGLRERFGDFLALARSGADYAFVREVVQ